MDSVESLSRQIAAQAIQSAIDIVNRAFYCPLASSAGDPRPPAATPRMGRPPIDHDRDAVSIEIRRLHGLGLVDANIARRVGRGMSFVAGRRKSMGLAGHAPSKNRESDDEIARMFRSSVSYPLIAKSCGVSLSTVCRRISDLRAEGRL